MLRRLPTPLLITQDDLSNLEETLSRRLAYIHYRKTGEDPEGLFTDIGAGGGPRKENEREESEREREKPVDPNDELKPLPGDRGRGGGARGAQERVMGGVPGARGR